MKRNQRCAYKLPALLLQLGSWVSCKQTSADMGVKQSALSMTSARLVSEGLATRRHEREPGLSGRAIGYYQTKPKPSFSRKR